MIKLFIQNKFTEIVNFFYRLLIEDTPCRYFAIWLMGMIPGSILAYSAIMTFDPTAIKFSSVTVFFVGWVYYTCFVIAVAFIHLILYFGCNWIKTNIELAKKGIKVKAEWKK